MNLLMNLKVQQIAVTGDVDRKSKLAKMRASVKNNYDFTIDNEESLVRYSADKPGAILPQIYLDKIRADFEGDIDSGRLNILLKLSETSLMLVDCAHWEVFALDTVMIDKLSSSLRRKTPVFVTNDIQLPSELDVQVVQIPLIDSAEISKSPYQLKDKYNKKLIKQAKVTGGLFIAMLLGVWLFRGDNEEQITVEPKQKVVVVKKHRKDNFYEYRKAIVDRVLYEDMFPALVTATLMASKVPNNWAIEEVLYQNNNVFAQIKHNQGETTQLKYFRDSIPNGRYIVIDGQKATFQYPIIQPSWFRWTKNKSDFVKTRDQFMDLMITLGGKMRSKDPVYNPNYTTQLVSFYFEDVSLGYLEVFNYIFKDKPAFIESITIKPNRNDKTMASIEISATIIGV